MHDDKKILEDEEQRNEWSLTALLCNKLSQNLAT